MRRIGISDGGTPETLASGRQVIYPARAGRYLKIPDIASTRIHFRSNGKEERLFFLKISTIGLGRVLFPRLNSVRQVQSAR